MSSINTRVALEKSAASSRFAWTLPASAHELKQRTATQPSQVRNPGVPDLAQKQFC
jgi:hypothetical protein